MNSMKWIKHEINPKKNNMVQNNANICYECRTKGYWSQICHTPKYLIDLYKLSIGTLTAFGALFHSLFENTWDSKLG